MSLVHAVRIRSLVLLRSKNQCERRAVQKGFVSSEKLALNFQASFSPALQWE